MSAKAKLQAPRPTLSRAAEARVLSDETRPLKCAHCGEPLEPPKACGRPRRTCSHSCRNAAYVRRVRGLPEAVPRMPYRGRLPLADIRRVKR